MKQSGKRPAIQFGTSSRLMTLHVTTMNQSLALVTKFMGKTLRRVFIIFLPIYAALMWACSSAVLLSSLTICTNTATSTPRTPATRTGLASFTTKKTSEQPRKLTKKRRKREREREIVLRDLELRDRFLGTETVFKSWSLILAEYLVIIIKFWLFLIIFFKLIWHWFLCSAKTGCIYEVFLYTRILCSQSMNLSYDMHMEYEFVLS